MVDIFDGKPWFVAETYVLLILVLVTLSCLYIRERRLAAAERERNKRLVTRMQSWMLAAKQAIDLAEDGAQQSKGAAITLEDLKSPARHERRQREPN